jgi:hypothetical protein
MIWLDDWLWGDSSERKGIEGDLSERSATMIQERSLHETNRDNIEKENLIHRYGSVVSCVEEYLDTCFLVVINDPPQADNSRTQQTQDLERFASPPSKID